MQQLENWKSVVEIAIGLNLGQNLGRETEVLGPSLSGWVRDGAPGAVRASFTIVLGHVAGCSSWRTGNLCGKALTWAQFRPKSWPGMRHAGASFTNCVRNAAGKLEIRAEVRALHRAFVILL